MLFVFKMSHNGLRAGEVAHFLGYICAPFCLLRVMGWANFDSLC
jgi:hypothetical protein